MSNQVEMELIQSNRSKGFAVGLVGELTLVTPFGAKLTEAQRKGLVWAATLQEDARSELAERVLARLQRDLGVTQDLHQQALVAAAPALAARVKAAKDAARRAAEAAEADRAVSRAETDPEPNEAVAFLLGEEEKARAALRTAQVQVARAAADGRRDFKAEEAARGALERVRGLEDKIRKARARQIDSAWSAQALAETRLLARSRGEDVELVEEKGEVRTRIKSRDGLRSLHGAGSLTDQQLAKGLTFRERFEAAHASKVAGGLAMLGGGRAASSDPAIAAAARNARLMMELAGIEKVVALGKRGPFRLKVLRDIAGQGRCVHEFATGGDAKRRLKTLLVEALELVDEGIALAEQVLANQAR